MSEDEPHEVDLEPAPEETEEVSGGMAHDPITDRKLAERRKEGMDREFPSERHDRPGR